jgi:hypothetical protein
MAQNAGTNYEAVTGSKQNFFSIFLTFERDTTNYRGTLVENGKKSKTNPPLCTVVCTVEYNLHLTKVFLIHRMYLSENRLLGDAE